MLEVEDFLKKNFPHHFKPAFDNTFSLRNYVEILRIVCRHYGKSFPEVMKNKKVLHIGSGPGYFLSLVRLCGGNGEGVEPYLNSQFAIRSKIENASLKGKFDIIIAHDVFVESVFYGNLIEVMEKLKFHLRGMLIIDNNIQEDSAGDIFKVFPGAERSFYRDRVMYLAIR
ncbi:MAG TPA: methyltransferase domain-containing protein [Candidatus Nanoarchaeia archaeon]|nr:methyltransferase domain-containing protein [Candidatus Nanoarchaeia archaeon]